MADTTIVLVEHDVPLVFELCSQVVVMELGRVVAAGPPEEVRADPQALAAYLGASDEALFASGPTGTTDPTVRGRSIDDEGDDEHIDDQSIGPVGRTWRRLRRRPRAMQMRTVLMILAVVVGLVIWFVLAPAGTPSSARAPAPARCRCRRPRPR